MLDWLIIGGGIHGTHLSFALTQQYHLPAARVRVLDPYPQPLMRWHQVTANTGMDYLRSPIVHHLHYDQGALPLYARIHAEADYTRFIPAFSRPSLELFNRYSQHLIDKYRLHELRLMGEAQGLERIPDGWRVETTHGGLEARHVMLAIGMGEQPHYPEWAKMLQAQHAPLHHLFDLDFDRTQYPITGHTLIVGGGITAAQVAIAIADRSEHGVTIVMRHSVRIHDFDSDPCWMNATCLRDFHHITDMNRRRQIIKSVRYRGSMPADVVQALVSRVEAGKIRLLTGEITAADFVAASQQFSLTLDGQPSVTGYHLLLATGWEQKRPGGEWLNNAIKCYNLPIADCQFPIIDVTLCWTAGLYTSAALAELEIGPAARNIIGARMASQRLHAVIHH